MKIYRITLTDGQTIDMESVSLSQSLSDVIDFLRSENPDVEIYEDVISKVEFLSEPIIITVEDAPAEPPTGNADLSDNLSPDQAAL